MSETNHVIVIGTGAAGMLAAIAVAGEGVEVELQKQNEKPGKKPPVADEGRCNVTSACDMEELLGSVVNNSRFLYSSFYGFINQNMTDLLKQAGFRLKAECGDRVFPQSDKSLDVISTLFGLMRQAGVKVRLNQRTSRLAVEDDVCKGVRYDDRTQVVGHVIVATGDLSYSTTRPTGDGLEWALDSGHRLMGLSPALVPFEMKKTETVKKLRGFLPENVEAAVHDGKRGLYRKFGEMLFTHFRVSGPVLLSASSSCAGTIRKKHLHLVIDLRPVLSWEQLDERIPRDFSDSRDEQFKNVLNHLYPAKLIPAIIAHSGMDPDRKVDEATREERYGLAEVTKFLELALIGLRGYKETIITQGGISVKDVSPSTMESKKVRGLYFTEETLDLDAVTGGFNLQIA